LLRRYFAEGADYFKLTAPRNDALTKKNPGLSAGTLYVDRFVNLFCCQQKHSRSTFKVEIKIKVKITVCLCDNHAKSKIGTWIVTDKLFSPNKR